MESGNISLPMSLNARKGSGGDDVRKSGLPMHGTRSGKDAVRKTGLPTHGTGSGGGAVRKSGLPTHGRVPAGMPCANPGFLRHVRKKGRPNSGLPSVIILRFSYFLQK